MSEVTEKVELTEEEKTAKKRAQLAGLQSREQKLLREIAIAENPEMETHFKTITQCVTDIDQCERLLKGEMSATESRKIEALKKKVLNHETMLGKEIITRDRYIEKVVTRTAQLEEAREALSTLSGDPEKAKEIRNDNMLKIQSIIEDNVDLFMDKDIDIEIAIPELAPFYEEILDYEAEEVTEHDVEAAVNEIPEATEEAELEVAETA